MSFVRFGSYLMRVEDIKSVSETPEHPYSRKFVAENGELQEESGIVPLQCKIRLVGTGETHIYVEDTLDNVQAKIMEAMSR